ncbi:MAG: hypothetical protein KIS66_06845 [Fimbriimonadaceae bacterium]|nr:hypothetical protein [Fimbriimonadaceae bacterium]
MLPHVAAAAFGLALAAMDFRTRPVQPVAGALLIVTMAFGAVWPRRAWRWALWIGGAVPALHVVAHALGVKPAYPVEPGPIAAFLALIPAFLGAYLGALLRRASGPDGQTVSS